MKLNNKGFAISSILYIILIMAVILVSLTLTILTSRKLIIDKLRKETLNNIYNRFDISYSEVLNILKGEIVSYATDNSITKESIKIGDFNTSLSEEIINGYKLDTKYLTVVSNNSNYDVYLGKKETIIGNNKEVKDLVDIIDYKIEGNSYQDLSSGNPSPSSPIEVLSVGDKIIDDTDSNYGKYNVPVIVKGKNLVSELLGGYTDITTFPKQSAGGSKVFKTIILKNVKAGTYTFSFEKPISVVRSMSTSSHSSNMSVKISNVNKTNIVKLLLNQDEEEYHLAFRDSTSSTTEWSGWVQCEIGDTATEYTPYVEPQTNNIYLDKPLRKVEDKIDYVSLSAGSIKRNVGFYNFDSSIAVNYANAGLTANNLYRSSISFKSLNDKMISGSLLEGYSNVLPANKQSWNKWTEEQVHFGQVNGAIYLLFNEEKTTLDDVYNYLSSDGIVEPYFIYQLNEEQIEDVTLPNIDTSIGTQTISVDTDIEPSSVEFTVIKKIKQL